ncbi:MAG: FAD-binding oxidoreductase [Alphaproteobacteria bacterium]|nr:FAD-binding oxidoreductase [Alphaproteobacteria bacterium]
MQTGYPSFSPPSNDLLDRFEQIVGTPHALRDQEDIRPFLREWRDRFHGQSPMVLRPGSVREITEIMKLANATSTAIVPQGGNTGLVGGQIPSRKGNELLLSLSRLNRILNIDTDSDTITVQAGCTLAYIQEKASSVNRLFPLRLGPDGQSQIGGNLSTNAGGVNALSYGTTRDLTLGLQVVLANGEILDSLRHLRKDNTGYDLKNIFIGSEGTLGIITAAVLKLFSRPRAEETVYIALPDPEAAIGLLHKVKDLFGQSLTSFELLPDIAICFGLRHISGVNFPFLSPSPWYILFDIVSGEDPDLLRTRVAAMLTSFRKTERVHMTAQAETRKQAQSFWQLRTGMSQAQKNEGGSIKHDIALPIGVIPKFLNEAAALVEKNIPGARPVPFGHLGDGNIHYNVSQPPGADISVFLRQREKLNTAIHALVNRHEGSISAEHGIGRAKRGLMKQFRSDVELKLMQQFKNILDPGRILNPGTLLPPAEQEE